ncbi:MAG: SGNH/GDSL hydrolase family protein [Planctomycetaceae bacterium]|nr:SGNH/GDSL hydrolase family protein [Planctomycetaceae bacterium]
MSGHAFFSGVGLIIAGVLLADRQATATAPSEQQQPAADEPDVTQNDAHNDGREVSAQPQPASAVLRRFSTLSIILGLLAVILSSAPLPLPATCLCVAATLFWIIDRFRQRGTGHRKPHLPLISMLIAWLTAAALELPWHLTPVLSPVTAPSLAIIGDSVTAGIGGDETSTTWPVLLAEQHQLNVQDISHVGETAKSALKRVMAASITAPLVIVEIGGNDILGATTVADFETSLNALLDELQQPGRQIVMFELPLPPLFHAYGAAQRQAARKRGISLIPKRVFLSILAGGDATLDSIHLSQDGHQAMCDAVWNVIGPATAAN